MAKRADNEMRQWALKGAEQRLFEIAQEAAAIHAAFPELREGRKGGIASRRGAAMAVTSAAPTRRRGRKRSAEARKRMSEAQKARWAKRKEK
jgi:hypothetical protein